MTHLWAVALVLVCACPAMGTSWRALIPAELYHQADLVIVGQASVVGSASSIVVERVLKGEDPGPTVRTVSEMKMSRLYSTGADGVFYLAEAPDRSWSPFHPQGFQPRGNIAQVEQFKALEENPAPFVDLAQHPEDENIVFLLGEVFKGFSVECPEAPRLEAGGTWHPYYTDVPWRDQARVVIEGYVDDQAGTVVVEVVEAPPKSLLASYYARKFLELATPSNGIGQRRWRCTIDARVPGQVGELSSGDASTFLRKRLSSDSPRVVSQALLALAKMREKRALPAVRRLARQRNQAAKDFVAWATAPPPKPLAKNRLVSRPDVTNKYLPGRTYRLVGRADHLGRDGRPVLVIEGSFLHIAGLRRWPPAQRGHQLTVEATATGPLQFDQHRVVAQSDDPVRTLIPRWVELTVDAQDNAATLTFTNQNSHAWNVRPQFNLELVNENHAPLCRVVLSMGNAPIRVAAHNATSRTVDISSMRQTCGQTVGQANVSLMARTSLEYVHQPGWMSVSSTVIDPPPAWQP